jgi:OmpA-OmpF porin, OOP family
VLPALPAFAQATSTSTTTSSTSMFASGTGRNLIGLNVGRSDYHVGCGIGFGCDTTDRYLHLYGRNMAGTYWGTELGILDLGNIERAGGKTKAQGINLSLVGELPVANSFAIFGKVGTTFGRTSTSSAPGSGISSGSENGFGLSYGAGLSYDFTPRITGVVGWDSHDFRFAGTGREPIRATSLGLQYKY